MIAFSFNSLDFRHSPTLIFIPAQISLNRTDICLLFINRAFAMIIIIYFYLFIYVIHLLLLNMIIMLLLYLIIINIFIFSFQSKYGNNIIIIFSQSVDHVLIIKLDNSFIMFLS